MIGDSRLEHSRLFVDDKDRERFLERLGERVEEYQIRLYLFVLMTNHFHLVFETPEGNCSKFMQSLSTAYTVYYNLRHSRHGHLMDGRYKAKLVEGDDYLLALSRYVHLNPVVVDSWKDKPINERIAFLRTYKWSSYPSCIDKNKTMSFVDYGPILAGMGGKRRNWRRYYREYVEEGLVESDEEFKAALKQSPRSIGGDGFRAWIEELYQERVEGSARPEDASFRNTTEPLRVEDVMVVLSDIFGVEREEFTRRTRNSPLRAVAARLLIRHAGLNQREVAERLCVGSGAAVCNQLVRLADKLSSDRRLNKRFQEADNRLRKLKARYTGKRNSPLG